jgi:putative ABC transport system substrate-binding protein
MRRRDFIAALGGAAALPLAARAQQSGHVRRIGVLLAIAESDPDAQPRVMAFQKGLEELGWKIGRNVRVHYRWAAGDANSMRAYAKELAELGPDVILTGGGTATRAVQRETRTVPIVFAQVADPVNLGLVPNLARPGGNTSGFMNLEPAMGSKWLEILKETVPGVKRVGVVHNPDEPQSSGYLAVIETAAASLRMRVVLLGVRSGREFDSALNAFAGELDTGLLVPPSATNAAYRDRLISLAAKHRLPAVYPFRYYVTSGGLVSYGADNIDQYRRAASYIDRILKGEKPADLPVQAPTKYELVVNLRTAKALGLTVPPTLLARADEVIE